ncbi:hypothetical protein KP509_09G027900 [Ceratopteris richardii]|uniref:Uncharacterized protein n=1 Tax=Ceratopteris richardii TaxID=49495 RepID=A0A8T2U553_CERRI|nr:hypothetical protein KP509_09G027900 [Ceratopteris richardii]
MMENGATRQSQRIRARGFRVRHYFLEEDGINTEASSRHKIEGCCAPSTYIGAVERNTLDVNLSEVIFDGRPTKLLRSSEVVYSWGIRRRRKRRFPKLPKAYQNLAAKEERCDVPYFVSGGSNGMEGCREHVKDDRGLNLAQGTPEPLLQYKSYNVQTRCRDYENAVNGFFSQQNQESTGYVTDPWATKTTCVSVDHAGENARNNVENHSQNMISLCHQENRFSIANSNQALVGQLNHAASQVTGKFESERRPSKCRKVMGMPDQLNRSVCKSLNHVTIVQQIQGEFGNELHVTGVNQYNTHGFDSFHEMKPQAHILGICEQRSHYSCGDQNVDQNRRLPQDVSSTRRKCPSLLQWGGFEHVKTLYT